jgi:hypothetical protein
LFYIPRHFNGWSDQAAWREKTYKVANSRN